MMRVSHRRASSKRNERPYGTRKNPDRMKNKGIRHMDSRAEPSKEPECPRMTIAMENTRSASIPTLRCGVFIGERVQTQDRKSTRLNSSHVAISYAVFCLKKKKRTEDN